MCTYVRRHVHIHVEMHMHRWISAIVVSMFQSLRCEALLVVVVLVVVVVVVVVVVAGVVVVVVALVAAAAVAVAAVVAVAVAVAAVVVVVVPSVGILATTCRFIELFLRAVGHESDTSAWVISVGPDLLKEVLLGESGYWGAGVWGDRLQVSRGFRRINFSRLSWDSGL